MKPVKFSRDLEQVLQEELKQRGFKVFITREQRGITNYGYKMNGDTSGFLAYSAYDMNLGGGVGFLDLWFSVAVPEKVKKEDAAHIFPTDEHVQRMMTYGFDTLTVRDPGTNDPTMRQYTFEVPREDTIERVAQVVATFVESMYDITRANRALFKGVLQSGKQGSMKMKEEQPSDDQFFDLCCTLDRTGTREVRERSKKRMFERMMEGAYVFLGTGVGASIYEILYNTHHLPQNIGNEFTTHLVNVAIASAMGFAAAFGTLSLLEKITNYRIKRSEESHFRQKEAYQGWYVRCGYDEYARALESGLVGIGDDIKVDFDLEKQLSFKSVWTIQDRGKLKTGAVEIAADYLLADKIWYFRSKDTKGIFDRRV